MTTLLDTLLAEWSAKGRTYSASPSDTQTLLQAASLRENENASHATWAALRDALENHTDLDEKSRRRAVERAQITSQLGGYPHTAEELCDLWFERYDLTCLYNGLITSGVSTMATADGTRVVLDANAMNDPRVVQLAKITEAEVNEAAISDEIFRFARRWPTLRNLTQTEIKVVLSIKISNCRSGRLGVLFSQMENNSTPNDDAGLHAYIARNFVIDDLVTVDFVAAVLKKFIHQVKNKMLKNTVTWHLMPVLLGNQGIGKSTFVQTMCGPYAELIRSVPFDEIADSRTTREIARTPIVLVDEMAGAKKAEMSKVKGLITATDADTRVLGTNAMVKSAVRTTFIGTANEDMDQLIRDKTGNRRFVGITMVANPDWSLVVDWRAVWSSVDVNVDPIMPFQETLKIVQSGQRSVSATEVWFSHFDGSDENYQRLTAQNNGWVSVDDLHGVFREWERLHQGGSFATDHTKWVREFNALNAANKRFDKAMKTSKRTTHYSYIDTTPAMVPRLVSTR